MGVFENLLDWLEVDGGESVDPQVGGTDSPDDRREMLPTLIPAEPVFAPAPAKSVLTKVVFMPPVVCVDHPNKTVIKVTRNREGLVVAAGFASHPGKPMCEQDKRDHHRLMSANEAAGIPYYFITSIGWGSEFGMEGLETLEECIETQGLAVKRAVIDSVFPPESWIRK